MKYILLILVILMTACNSQKNTSPTPQTSKPVKTRIDKHYALLADAKEELIEYSEIHFDRKENPILYIDHLSEPKDTISDFPEYDKKITGTKICFYENEKALICRDTSATLVKNYDVPESDVPTSYELYDSKGLQAIIEYYEGDNLPYRKSFMTNRKTDTYGSLTSYLKKSYYLPKDFKPTNEEALKIKSAGLQEFGDPERVDSEYSYYEN